MSEYRIDKGIPLPPDGRSSGKRNGQNVFMHMDVGDSVFVPAAEFLQRGHSLSAYASYKMSVQFTRRAACENGVEGVRVWRVK